MNVFILSLINTYTGCYETEAVFKDLESAKTFISENEIDEDWLKIEEWKVAE